MRMGIGGLLGLGFGYEKWEEALGCGSLRKGAGGG